MNFIARIVGLFGEKKYLILGVILGVAVVLGGMWVVKNTFTGRLKGNTGDGEDVAMPTIVNGQLVLPKLATASGGLNPNLNRTARLGVVSVQLIPVADSQQTGQQKLAGIRILGETQNLGEQIVSGVSPIVRFFDKGGKVIGQKVGRLSTGWDFFGVAPSETTLYDVTVDNPPTADKLEVVLNVAAATSSAVFEPLKIASRSVEVKTATYQNNSSSSSNSGESSSRVTAQGDTVEYYTVSGAVVNALSDPVSDISVYAWVKDKDNKVYAFTRQDFKNDLLAAGDKIDFRMTLLPLKGGESYSSYEVAAWGKRYKLNL